MAVVNGWPTQNPATQCAYCGEPFKQKENHIYAWRSSSGKLYCSEFCADNEGEPAPDMCYGSQANRVSSTL
jgi:hypothetical protein